MLNLKTYLAISGVFLGLIALIHLIRALAGWPLVIGPFDAPMTFSWIAFLFAGFLSASALRLVGKS